MGITGLESFSINCVENGFEKFSILDGIDEWKKRNNDKHPVILIDIEKIFKAMVQTCVESIESLMLGGRHNIYHKNLDSFFKKLLSLGVRLVFFGKGMERHDLEWFAEQEEKQYKKYVNGLTEIDLGTVANLPTREHEYWLSFSTELKTMAEKYGQFYLTFNDHSQDIATYALTHHENILAIWCREIDFLAFHATSHIQYWSLSCDHLDFTGYTTYRFDVAAIHQSLMLSTQQVSMFGAILHFYYTDHAAENSMTDFFDALKWRRYHYDWKKIKPSTRPSFERIMRVAEFVQNNVSADIKLSDDDFVNVSNAILGTHSNPTTVDQIKEEYGRYDIANFPAPPEPLLYSARNCNFINKMLNNLRFQLFDIQFTDFRPMFGIPYIDLMFPCYRKQAGVILQHKKDELLECKFAIKLRHETPIEEVVKEPIYPEIQVPDLQHLYDNNRNDDEDMEEIKWQLLFWILDIEPQETLATVIRSMTEKYLVVVVLTIRHMLKNKAISRVTADALLWTEFKTLTKDDPENNDKVHERTADERESILFPAKKNGRAIRNAHLYNIVRKMINDCMQTCGLSSFIEIPRFDGLLFHNTIEQFAMPDELFLKSLKEIERFRVYV